MRVKILQQLNSSFGRFMAGTLVDSLPDETVAAWVAAGVAETVPLPVEADPQPVVVAQPVKAGTKMRSQHPSQHNGPFWSEKG